MAKDYRTWWRRGYWIADEETAHLEAWASVKFGLIPFDYYTGDDDNYDCILEQIWAIREGLSEVPERGE